MKRSLLFALAALMAPALVHAKQPAAPPPAPAPTQLPSMRPAPTPAPAPPAAKADAPDESADHPASSARMLKRLHTRTVLRLADLLELDTQAAVQLAGRLERFSAERVRLAGEVFEASQQLREAVHGQVTDAAAASARLSKARVELAQLDSSFAAEAIKGVTPDKAARAALFLARTPARMMWLAARAHGRGHWGRPPMGPPGMGGPGMGPGGMGHWSGGCAGGCSGGMTPPHGEGHRPGGIVPPPPIRKGVDAAGGAGPIDDEEWELD